MQRERQEARIAELRAGQGGARKSSDPGAVAGEGEDDPPLAQPGMSAEAIRQHAIDAGDPRKGEFSLADATRDLEGEGALWVRFETGRGNIECRLLTDQAPLTVANFVGLARGLRPFKDPKTEEWKTGPYYDGTVFHRVIPGFMIQGGDPLGTGLGNAGYVLPEEIRPALKHESAGVLSMANRGPGTGSSQFFITLGPTPHLDGKHTIFGRCTEDGVDVADNIALTPRSQEDRPLEPEALERVVIFRKPAAPADEAAGPDNP